jgi:hypothetical protein
MLSNIFKIASPEVLATPQERSMSLDELHELQAG